MQVDIDMDSKTITGLKDPTNDQEAVSKGYLLKSITTNLIQYYGTISSLRVLTINGLPFTRSDAISTKKVEINTHGSRAGDDRLFYFHCKE